MSRKMEDYYVFVGSCFCEGLIVGNVLREMLEGEMVTEFVLR